MYQFSSAAHERAWKRPGYIRLRVERSTANATKKYSPVQWGDVNGVV